MRLTKEKKAWLDRITLNVGSHKSLDQGACVMEAVSYIAGEPWSDKPKCASGVIGAFMRRWNDDLDDAGRQKLKPYVRKLVGTAASSAVEDARAWLACDWMVRTHTAAWLDLAGLKDQATALRELPPITKANCHGAMATIAKAREKADAAGAAAWAAAGAAARAAAWAAAWAAAGAAARAAAWDAARAAAWAAAGAAARAAAWAAAGAAARAAAWDAARDALEPTKLSLQRSAFDLLDRMIALQDAP